MTHSEQFKALLTHFERNNATGSLKSANTTLAKILVLLQEQIDALTATPQQETEVSVRLAELGATTAALKAQTEAVAARVEEGPSHYEAAQAIVGDPALIEPNDVPREVENPPETASEVAHEDEAKPRRPSAVRLPRKAS